jgi:hypothetical protein
MHELEGIAAELLSAVGLDDAPGDAFALAELCGLTVVSGAGRGARREGDVVYVDSKARRTRQHGLVAHEIGHWALERVGENPHDEPAARFLSGALLVPRRRFDRDLRATWRLDELMAMHANASGELLARRIAELRDAVVTIVDNGRVRSRFSAAHVYAPVRMTRVERELVAEALERGHAVEGGPLVHATPLVEGAWQRVIVVAEVEQLAMRW